ncbi:hypothetical protein BJP34_29150 [Moorena producens PAL-8-15-08-1]|uniref:Transposase IS4-like domain-containing protein n=1 Tax=Moorena producens PAL-8-15-08-1 TaxID=1458985 RepID=A0A1D8TZA3_9CYAN|nr:DDE transposase family protein [Moorena producens]AOX02967.1 hypothetical protein BJP34_29150 [Moorena producens PAL-8-15-08-1]
MSCVSALHQDKAPLPYGNFKRSGTRGNEPFQTISYYLCSKSPQSRRLMDGIRGHWLIENSLHWVKDVIYKEDISPQKSGFAPKNLSLLKTWVLTLLRAHGFDSIKAAISEAMQRGLGEPVRSWGFPPETKP